MFFVLSKALLFILSPFFWFISALAIFMFWKKNSGINKIAKWLSIGIFFVFSNSVIFSKFCKTWEVPGIKYEKVQKHDVAIVLGGMFEYNSDLDAISIRRQGDRLFQAITLYKTGKVDKLLISGDSGYLTDRGLHEAIQIKDVLLKWGIPANDILTENKSVNTHENATETAKILNTSYPHLNKFLLVTSGIHMKRALACFEKEGIHCTPYSTDLYANQSGNYYWDQYLIPNLDNFKLWNKLLKESVGYLAYWMAGYL